MGAVLGLSSMTVSILFFCRFRRHFLAHGLPDVPINALNVDVAVGYLLPAGWLADVVPDWFGVMNVWTLLIPAALFFSVPGCCFHWLPAARWSRSPPGGHRWRAGRRSAKHWFRRVASLSAMLPQTGQGSLGLLMP